ncbi:hypothetical protein BMW23_0174 [Bodo saltans virus]|uniref:Uncharacterized protein n=1 Tax=Bodo saltans virus TaxID=2024608 RepID=A0A2H4UTG6_9VIRU|nr:hypothetical protein QJ851_gp0169 [Bodo saltans virus]ATZ80232.1 hypothetical protein BMW23_0174 [Bodo saltans virus]
MDEKLQKIILNNGTVENIILYNKLEDLKNLIICGLKLNKSHLEYSFSCKNNDIIVELLNQKIIPTQKCFVNFIDDLQNLHDDEKINSNGYYDGINIEQYDKFNFLIHYGYKLTQDDFYLMTSVYHYLPTYEKYGLVINDKIKNICKETLFFPYCENKFTKNEILKILEKSPDLKTLKSIIKKYDVKPDQDFVMCLVKTCKVSAFNAIYFIHENYEKYDLKLLCKICKIYEYGKIKLSAHFYKFRGEYIEQYIASKKFADCNDLKRLVNDDEKLQNFYSEISEYVKNAIKVNQYSGYTPDRHTFKLTYESYKSYESTFNKIKCEQIFSKYDDRCYIKLLNLLCYLLYQNACSEWNTYSTHTSAQPVYESNVKCAIKFFIEKYKFTIDIDDETMMILDKKFLWFIGITENIFGIEKEIKHHISEISEMMLNREKELNNKKKKLK